MIVVHDPKTNIIEVEPTGQVKEEDFQQLELRLEAAKKNEEPLHMLIHTKDFPGFRSFSDFMADVRFSKEHRNDMDKIAIVTDSSVGKLSEVIGNAISSAEVKKFSFHDKKKAEEWLLN